MLKINQKTFLNIQEAVQWLLDNNALPFQCSANYAANTEIGLGTIVNPTMAKVRVGSIIFFTDSKVSTVTGVSSTGFTVSDQYIDLADDVRYITSVEIIANGLLSVTFSDGSIQTAGLIKMCTSFAIDSSQHLIAYFNDNTQVDLGAIFQGNVNISGDLDVSGDIRSNGNILGESVNVKSIDDIAGQGYIGLMKPLRGFENIADNDGHFRFVSGNLGIVTISGVTYSYYKWSLSGSHIMFVLAGTIDNGTSISNSQILASVELPQWIRDKIFPVWAGSFIERKEVSLTADDWSAQTTSIVLSKAGIYIQITNVATLNLTATRHFRLQFDLMID